MTKRISIVFALLISGLAAGCNDAEEKCKDFADAFCDRLATCTSSSKDDCLADFAKRIDCSKAVDAPGNFNECVPAVKKLECSKITSIPDSCNISVSK
jgi:hypothetical protein